tara:strand:+ start:5069 stop:5563 length:495 start_codon:yes stop_codon:yes gene_type:complete
MIADDVRQKAGKRNRSGDWYISQLELSLDAVQDPDISQSDTNYMEIGDLMFFSYGAKYAEKLPFWDLQPLTFVLKWETGGFLGANLHYINPDYRDAVAKSLINSGSGAVVPKNSIHRYLFSGIGNLYKIPKDEDWGSISLLPTEKFYTNKGKKFPKHRAWNWNK